MKFANIVTIADSGGPARAPRLTNRQSLVYNAILNRRDHPSAQTIHRQLIDFGENISLATTYRQLAKLVSFGLINPIELGEETRYCPGKSVHAHLHCSRCDQVTNVKTNEQTISDLIESCHDRQIQRTGEELCFDTQIIITGVCDDCCGIHQE